MMAPPEKDRHQNRLNLDDLFLAPWGLANEELPMHVLWDGSAEAIEIEYSENINIVDVYNFDGENIDQVKESSSLRFREDQLITPGYISIIFKDENIYEDAVVPHDINITIKGKKGEEIQASDKTHIIRPQIEVQNKPDEIVLTNEQVPDQIEIDMKYVGFGMAKVAVEAEAEGEFVSEGESFLHDLIDGILETEVHKSDTDALQDPPPEWENDADIEVPQEEIEEIVEDMRGALQDGSFTEDYDSEELFELAEVLQEAEESSSSDSGIAAVIYRFIETALLTSILNVVDRHPAENVSLSKPETRIQTKAKAREMVVEVHLKDNLDNEYDPESIPIKITDKRNNGGLFETEISTNWENYQVDPDEVFSND